MTKENLCIVAHGQINIEMVVYGPKPAKALVSPF